MRVNFNHYHGKWSPIDSHGYSVGWSHNNHPKKFDEYLEEKARLGHAGLVATEVNNHFTLISKNNARSDHYLLPELIHKNYSGHEEEERDYSGLEQERGEAADSAPHSSQ